MRILALSAVVAIACGCNGSSASSGAQAADAGAEAAVLGAYDPVAFGGSRPVQLYVPSGYKGTPTPLVILLHGYGVNGAAQDLYLGLRAVAEAKTVLYAHPDGTFDPQGHRYWNATDACCDFWGAPVDDSAYLSSLVKEIATRYAVDPKRVYFMGHSNGGFMSYRMACDHADQVAAIVSISGATWLDTSKCKPSQPVAVLEVHGTGDTTIAYDGGTTATVDPYDAGHPGGGQFPGATTTVAYWAGYDGCQSPPDTSQPDVPIDQDPTHVTRYASGCRASAEVDLWSMQGENHVPAFTSSFAPMALDFLLAHHR